LLSFSFVGGRKKGKEGQKYKGAMTHKCCPLLTTTTIPSLHEREKGKKGKKKRGEEKREMGLLPVPGAWCVMIATR